ncbi:MAG: hypothetical protein ACOH2R_07665 [Pseudomonas sp.]
MRFPLVMSLAALTLAGCASTPNSPSYTLSSSKTASDYAHCVLPKWQKEASGTTLSETQGHYKIVASSKVAADDIMEIYKASPGSKIFVYHRVPLSSTFGRNTLETAARDCL